MDFRINNVEGPSIYTALVFQFYIFSPQSLTDGLVLVDHFLLFHSPVLKPDGHLSLGQVCVSRYPSSFVLSDELICGIFSF